MKSVLDAATRNSLISRIQQLDENSNALWGKMNVYQMVHHCALCEELYLGKIMHKRSMLGRLFGKKGLKNILAEDKSFPKNAPTSSVFKVKETNGDLAAGKKRWISLLDEYENFPGDYIHWFFGKMTREQVGLFVYKHDDHHLRQFGV